MSVHKMAAKLCVLAILVFASILGYLANPQMGEGAASSTIDFDSSVTLLNAGPQVTSLYLNNGDPIILTPAASTTINVSFTVSDDNGCGDVFYDGSVSVKVFRSGVGQSCAVDNKNCYAATLQSNSCPSATSTNVGGNATATVSIGYFADPTDTSSTYSGETWQAYVQATDAGASAGSTTTNPGVELNTLLAIELDKSSISYGQIEVGTNTGGNNQTTTLANAGNAKLNIKVAGTAMASGGDTIATDTQHFATSGFTYGTGDQWLSDVETLVPGAVMSRVGDFTLNYLPQISSWTVKSAMPGLRSNMATAYHNNRIYVVGGYGSSYALASTTYIGEVGPDGAVSNWQSGRDFPVRIGMSRGLAIGSRLYLINGDAAIDGTTTTVWFADINGDHSLGAWTTTQSTLSPCQDHAVASNGSFVYSVAGWCTQGTTTVSFSVVSSTGALGPWQRTTSLARQLENHAAVTYNDYLYVIGGYAREAGVRTSTVQYAAINATGSLGAWTNAVPLPSILEDHRAAVSNGYLYVAGGSNGTVTSTVYYALINATGSLGQWTKIQSLPTADTVFGFVSDGKSLFKLGGGTATATVLSANFATSSTGGGPSTSTIFWGTAVPSNAGSGSYNSTITYTAVWAP